MKRLIEGGNLSQFALINAVARTAADTKCYDRTAERATAGVIVLDYKPIEWRELAILA